MRRGSSQVLPGSGNGRPRAAADQIAKKSRKNSDFRDFSRSRRRLCRSSGVPLRCSEPHEARLSPAGCIHATHCGTLRLAGVPRPAFQAGSPKCQFSPFIAFHGSWSGALPKGCSSVVFRPTECRQAIGTYESSPLASARTRRAAARGLLLPAGLAAGPDGSRYVADDGWLDLQDHVHRREVILRN